MPNYVRYRNRKIHEIGSKNAYVRSEDICKVLQKRGYVYVEDEETGKDVTSQVLSNILSGLCKKDRDFVLAEEIGGLIDKGLRRRDKGDR